MASDSLRRWLQLYPAPARKCAMQLQCTPTGGFRATVNVSSPSLDGLPFELQLHIFRQLDPETLCRAALVCRTWYAVATDPLLVRAMPPAGYGSGPGLSTAGSLFWVVLLTRQFIPL